MTPSFCLYPVLSFNKAYFYNRYPLEVAVPSKTALSHSLLTGLRINICINICISERKDIVV